MAASFKSHVLMRDEKGMFGIPFKRLLLAGVSGGFAYTALRLGVPSWAIPGGVVVALIVLVMSGLRGGIPLWQRWLLGARGALLLAATRSPGSLSGQVASALELPIALAQLDAAEVFAPPHVEYTVELREWASFAHAPDADHDDGLIFVESPLTASTIGEGDHA